MVGRKPTPTVLKLAAGNPGKRRLNADEPQFKPLDALPPCPDWLGRAGTDFWHQQAPLALAAGTLHSVSLPAFQALCASWDEYRLASDARSRRQSLEMWRNLATDFGMTPAAAVRIKATPQNAHRDPIQAFKAQRPARPA